MSQSAGDAGAPRTLVPVPLTAEAFAPYGDVLEARETGRFFFDERLENRRAHARPSVSVARIAPSPAPHRLIKMERHEHSSQSFLPMAAARWLVVVAPDLPDGGPDMARARAFLPAPGQGITYACMVWHAPMSVFDAEALFGVVMWNDGTAADTTFIDLAAPVVVSL
jgi:ureidoglycolate lyase